MTSVKANAKSVTILGAGYAGLLAALRLAHQCDVTLISRSDMFVERIRLHQEGAGQTIQRKAIRHYLRGTTVKFVQGNVTALDPVRKEIQVDSAGTLSYDTLIYALGSHTDRDTVPGVREFAYTLAPDDMSRFHQAAQRGGSVVICGGGLTGIETSTELAESYRGVRVTLLTRDELGQHLSPRGKAHLKRVFRRLGITLIENVEIERLTAHQVITNRGAFEYDQCIWAGSFTAPKLAHDSGILTNERGQIIVDETLRSVSHRDIYAVGDSAFVPGIRMACATAMPMGAHVADNILKGDAPFRFGYFLQCISLGRHNGLVQFVHSDDSPRSRILTGRAAAWVKELICSYTTFSLGLERRRPGTYAWPHPAAKTTKKELELAR